MSSRASQSPLTRFLQFLLTISIFGSFSLSVPAEETTSLPVEFFFGRWANGATFNGTGMFEERVRPRWTIGGGYANDLFRVGGGIDFIPSTQFVEQSSAAGFAAFRPGTRFQIAIDE